MQLASALAGQYDRPSCGMEAQQKRKWVTVMAQIRESGWLRWRAGVEQMKSATTVV
jgi:hypothetical protein